MKKALLFAILALSINAFAQNKRPTSNLQHPTLNPMENIHGRMQDARLKTPGMYSEQNLGQAIKHQVTELNSSIQINDSIYNWYWDTTNLVWQFGYKTINIVYDASNNLTSNLVQHWNGSTWENSYQLAYTYDANKNKTSELWQMYSWDAGILENFLYRTYTYDDHNNQTSNIYYGWYGSVWVKNMQTIYTYDVNDNLASESLEGSSVTPAKIFYTYDASNNNTNIIEQINNGSGWVNYIQATYTFNANNKQTSYIEQPWKGSDWGYSRKDTLTYDANNNQIGFLSQNWDSSTWMNSYKRTSAYDANNNRISDLSQNWTDNAWVNSSKDTITYDANKNNTSYFGQNWDGNNWVKSSIQTATFDGNNFAISYTYKYWNTEGTQVMYSDSTYNYFHTVITGIQKIENSDISVYPNPTNGKFTVINNKASTIEIYNLQGARIYADYKFKKQTSNEIDLSGYAKGIYLVKIYDGTKIQSRKVVVQ